MHHTALGLRSSGWRRRRDRLCRRRRLGGRHLHRNALRKDRGSGNPRSHRIRLNFSILKWPSRSRHPDWIGLLLRICTIGDGLNHCVSNILREHVSMDAANNVRAPE